MPNVAVGVVLDLLGLGQYKAAADMAVSVAENAAPLIERARAMLETEQGKKLRENIAELIASSEKTGPNEVMIGKPKGVHKSAVPVAGKYEWDSLQGWVWKPAQK